MSTFNWSTASGLLQNFGGEPVILYVEKTGLPFYDVLRLYGTIDLYIGLREDVVITDMGVRWKISGRKRTNFILGRDVNFLRSIWNRKKPNAEDFCKKLYINLVNGEHFSEDVFLLDTDKTLDASLQAGIRGRSAASYDTLQTGQTSKKECKAMVPLSDGLLAFAGKKRTDNLSNIYFLPVFQGKIDLSKVVSPLRVRIGSTNVLCAQMMMLLALKTSLFAEGYYERLVAIVYNTQFGSRNDFNYSGLIEINSTAIGQMKSSDLVSHTYRIFKNLVNLAWDNNGKTNDLTSDAMAMAYWLMQPVSKHLSSMITSQERLRRGKRRRDTFVRQSTLFDITGKNYAKEVFEMTYKNWNGDHEVVRKLAKAVASSIQWARCRDKRNNKWLPDEDQRKNWYDEVTMLRSAPSEKAFIERVMILIEQGHREKEQIGTVHRQEDFDPKMLLNSIGNSRSEFETFRDLFRMYLVQESSDNIDIKEKSK